MANKLLKSITFPDLTDKYIIGDTSLSISGAAADAKTTGDEIADLKALGLSVVDGAINITYTV